MSSGGGALIGSFAAIAYCVVAGAQGNLSFDAAVEYTHGDYGGTVDYDDLYVPLTLTYRLRRLDLRLTRTSKSRPARTRRLVASAT